MPERRIATAFLAACRDELEALKPGNVHRHAEGHGMTVEDFRRSAAVAAPAISARDAPLGRRIHAAIAATHSAIGCNTNLGIVLLCAPLARAAETLISGGRRLNPSSLAAETTCVLARLNIDDAELTYRAIALANPGGLGDAGAADVRKTPQLPLLFAMRIAAQRDRIARQYATDFFDVFVHALPCLRDKLASMSHETAVAALYLDLLAHWPDSHLLRKFGDTAAQSVTQEAAALRRRVVPYDGSPDSARALLEWDHSLKQRGLNPGTTADLTVATLFVHHLTR